MWLVAYRTISYKRGARASYYSHFKHDKFEVQFLTDIGIMCGFGFGLMFTYHFRVSENRWRVFRHCVVYRHCISLYQDCSAHTSCGTRYVVAGWMVSYEIPVPTAAVPSNARSVDRHTTEHNR